MANLDFKEDLSLGNKGEKIVVDFLASKGGTFKSFNNDNKFDVLMDINGKATTYEIKTDVKCAPLFDTGNLFIEFESRGKPSGVATSEADWFVTYFEYLNEVWFIKTERLKSLIKEHNFPVFNNAGDIGSATHGYLINRKLFKMYFYVSKVS